MAWIEDTSLVDASGVVIAFVGLTPGSSRVLSGAAVTAGYIKSNSANPLLVSAPVKGPTQPPVGGSSVQFSITETLAGKASSPKTSTFSLGVINSGGSLSAASLSSNVVVENSPAGTFIGNVNYTSGATVTLINDAGGKVTLSGTQLLVGLVNTDYETATSYSITIRQTSAGLTLDSVLSISVTDVPLPSFSSAPSLTGTPTQGQTLTGTDGTLTAGNGASITSRKWQRLTGSTVTDLVTTQNYVPVSGDVGNQVRFVNVATNAEGTTTANSSWSPTIGAAGAIPVVSAVSQSYTDTSANDTFSNKTGNISATQSPNTYGIGGTGVTGTTTVSKVGTYGTLAVVAATGAYTYTPNNAAINAVESGSPTDNFVITATNGTGTGTGSFVVTITGVPELLAPSVTPISFNYNDTAANDTFSTMSGNIVGTNSPNTYGIGGTGVTGTTTVSKTGTYGVLSVVAATGVYSYVPNNAAINAVESGNPTDNFVVTATNATGTGSAAFTVTVNGVPESAAGNLISATVVDSVTDASGHIIPTRGYVIALVFQGMGARHPITDPLTDATSLVINITRPGFTATGAVTTVPDVVYGTRQLHNTFPEPWSTLPSTANGIPARSWCSGGPNNNEMYYTELGGTKGATPLAGTTDGQTYSDGGVSWVNYNPNTYTIFAGNTNNPGFVNPTSGGNVTVYMTLDFPIYQVDQINSIDIGAGAYRSTRDPSGNLVSQVSSNARTGMTTGIVNSSTLQYGYPCITKVSLMHEVSTGSLRVEYHVGSPWGRNSRQIACSKHIAYNWSESVNTGYQTVTTTVPSLDVPASAPAGVTLEVVAATLDTSGLGFGDCFEEAEFYPWVGDKAFKTRLHAEGRNFVSGTTYTGFNEIVRAGAYIYSLSTPGSGPATNTPVHSSGSATGADGYTWLYIGSALLTAQTGSKYGSGNIQARHHFLNEITPIRRGFAYFNDTGNNVGTPDVYPDYATAVANKANGSWGSAKLCLDQIRIFHAAAGTGFSHDDTGGGTAIALAGTHAGFGASLASLPIGSEWTYIKADPAAAPGTVNFATGSFKVGHRRMKMIGFKATITSTALISSGESTAVGMLTNEMVFESWDLTGTTGAILAAASGANWFRKCTVTGGITLQTENQRAHCVDMMGSSFNGVAALRPRISALAFKILAGNTAIVADAANGTYLPEKLFYSFGRCNYVGSALTQTNMAAILVTVNNPTYGSIFETHLLESIYISGTSIQPCLRIAADGSSTNVTNVSVWNGTCIGERTNIGYNDALKTPLRENIFMQNCLNETRAVVTDMTNHPTSADLRGQGRFNNYWTVHSVGFRDNVTFLGNGSTGTNPTTGVQTFGRNDIWGVYSSGTSMLGEFVSNKSRDAGAGNNTGNGDYRPSPTGLAVGKAKVQGWKYDLYGNVRRTNTTASIGALES